MPISAEIICDSINVQGDRLTTFVLTYPRIIHAEVMTHRVFSRNAASSRAIPFKKMLKSVWKDPFIPKAWMKDHTGMQGTSYFTGFKAFIFRQLWLSARNFAIVFAFLLSKFGLTKQICNRLLEPFLWYTCLVTATEFDNFFALRAHDAAEIHLQDLAYKMLDAYNTSEPKLLQPGEWHIPFGDKIDELRLIQLGSFFDAASGGIVSSEIEDAQKEFDELKLKICTARAARISYNTFEGKDDYDADIKLHDRLLAGGHMSPLEHCARAMTDMEYIPTYGQCGNFRGFIQYRKTIAGENKTDPRVHEKVINS